ncbi:MAG: 1,4-beta-xylanase, partial [Oscillospiraceae bacterium]|nr:1,4-beta-xylanase [Oscillospiraceae bacterium]
MNFKRMLACLTSMICMAGTLAAFPQAGLVQATEAVHNSFDRNYDGWYGNSDVVSVEAVDGAGFGGSRAMAVTGRQTAADGAVSSKGLYLWGGIKYNYSV